MNNYLITVDINGIIGKMKKCQICIGFRITLKKLSDGFCCLCYCNKILEEVELVEKADLAIVMQSQCTIAQRGTHIYSESCSA